MRGKKRQRLVAAEESIGWVWEDDDPAAAACGTQHLDVGDQSADPAELRVYDGLLASEREQEDGSAEDDAAGLDRTLTNILVFADDCRAATEWLSDETVSHDDEQGRRSGQRRRHLKERGRLTNAKPFVRICGQTVIDSRLVAVMAARQCIDNWEETEGQRSLHFHKREAGMRWEPCTALDGISTRMCLSNPFTAPPATQESDGPRVEEYLVTLSDDKPATAERRRWDTDDEDTMAAKAEWMLNSRAETAMEWLAEAADAVADITSEGDDRTLRELFPSLRESKRRARPTR